jgi:tripartite-type tricarboxylate transporter receptor subunit TctC
MAAPKGTPPALVGRLAKEIAAALAEPAVRQKYEDLGLTPVGSTPEQFASGLPEQAQKWRTVLQKIGKVTN